MLEGEITVRLGEIASGPGQCRRVVLDKAQLIESNEAAWVIGIESGIIASGPTAAECLIDFYEKLNSQIDFPDLNGLPHCVQSDDSRAEYLNTMRSRMRQAIEPPPDVSDGWDQMVEFYDGMCGLEHNRQYIPLVDVDNLSF